MKYIRMFSKVVIVALFYAMIATILAHTTDINMPFWMSMAIGALTVMASWED